MQLRSLFAIARADFLERTRRASFLIMLGLMLWVGYLVNIGQITLHLENYRGIFNSAWIGSMMTLVVNFLLAWFGFYLIKNAITRDYQTGVGQIMAATPLRKPLYLLGKWLSNMAVLDLMVVVLMLASLGMQLLHQEVAQINAWAMISPFLFVALPVMAMVSAIAVFFETIPWLRGGIGNVIYFFLFTGGVALISITQGMDQPAFDWLGFGVFKNSMSQAALAAYPAYGGGFSLGFVPNHDSLQTFVWNGVPWTLTDLIPRLGIWLAALLLTLISALFFDRFSGVKINRKKQKNASHAEVLAEQDPAPTLQAASLTPIRSGSRLGSFVRLIASEARLILREMPWWWYLGWLGLIVVSTLVPQANFTAQVLPMLLIWPLLIWSKLGCREQQFSTCGLVFSAPRPLTRQLAAGWLAGVSFSLVTALGALLRFGLAANWTGFVALLVGMLFIPSLALGLGVLSGTSKTFEVLYAFFWYLGVLNDVLELDFSGIHASGNTLLYLGLSVLMLGVAVFARQRQIDNVKA